MMFTACAPAQKPVRAPGITAANPVSLPITVLTAGGSNQASNASNRAAPGTDPLLPELRDLVLQRRADLLGRPGWLHRITRSAGGENSLSSIWGEASSTRQEEEWLELDANEYVLRAVKRLLNDDLQPVQSSVLMNGTWWNLTLGSERPADEAHESKAFDPNDGFYELVIRLDQPGHFLAKSTIYKECWYQGEQYSVSDGVYNYTAVFNPDKHSLHWLKTWKISPAPVTLVESKEILVEERADQPPAEILGLLNHSRTLSLR